MRVQHFLRAPTWPDFQANLEARDVAKFSNRNHVPERAPTTFVARGTTLQAYLTFGGLPDQILKAPRSPSHSGLPTPIRLPLDVPNMGKRRSRAARRSRSDRR